MDRDGYTDTGAAETVRLRGCLARQGAAGNDPGRRTAAGAEQKRHKPVKKRAGMQNITGSRSEQDRNVNGTKTVCFGGVAIVNYFD
jgi:hypothetical protein